MSTTTKYGIPYADPVDMVGDFPALAEDQAERLDLLLGEQGLVNVTPSGTNIDHTVRVNFGRSYAALAPMTLTVTAWLEQSIGTGTTVETFADTVDATGFTLHVRATNLTTRPIRWAARAAG